MPGGRAGEPQDHDQWLMYLYVFKDCTLALLLSEVVANYEIKISSPFQPPSYAKLPHITFPTKEFQDVDCASKGKL